jgi:periplasmic copper chaperone A
VKVPFRYLVPALVAAAWLALPALAQAHARVSPAVSLSGQLQLYSLAVPTEKSAVSTTKVMLTVPTGFGIDSFVPPPAGWHQQVAQTGAGDNAVVTRVTWSGGHTPTGEDSLFQFLAQPAGTGTYTFTVTQTYSDGSIVTWNGPQSAESAAPTIEVRSSLGGGGSPLLSIIAIVIGALGLAAGGFALVARHGRELI